MHIKEERQALGKFFDIAAAALSRACVHLGLRIPEDVALLGFNDDLILCRTATPPLSSIGYPGEKIGYGAARLLSDMMEGAKRIPKVTRISPSSIVSRESSDTLAFGDALIADAVRVIRLEAPEKPLRVAELISRLPTSRAAFQKRFLQAVALEQPT